MAALPEEEEREPLIPPRPFPKIGAGGLRKRDPPKSFLKEFAKAITPIALMPFFTFATIGLLFVFLYHHLHILVLAAIILWTGLCTMGAVLSRNNGAFDKSYTYMMCVLMALSGFVVGGYNYSHAVSDYWAVSERMQYTNVWPDEPAISHGDAGAIVFAQNTRPDTRLPSSYAVGQHKYCVASLTIRHAAIVSPEVQYWAVGMDCCANEEFYCGDSTLPGTRAGVRVFEKTDVFSQWLVSMQDIHYYEQAAEMATAKFGISKPEKPMFFHWVADIDAAQQAFWQEARAFWVMSVFAAFPLCFVLAMGESGIVTMIMGSAPKPLKIPDV
jgi:hypothetical protein